jgi:glutamate racemase
MRAGPVFFQFLRSPRKSKESLMAQSRDENTGMNIDDRPIGLFDSGIGGLTVLKTLLGSLPNESFLYLGDTARLPYGSKSPQTIERYLIQNIDFLVSRKVKAVVVACNSASTVLLGSKLEFPVPVYNVIEPGAESALKVSVGKRIGVLGTRATVAAKAYVRALHEREPSAQVFQQACPLLVPLVEEGMEDDPITNLIIYRYLTPLLQAGVDTLILGCTHYPALKNGITKASSGRVALVDSSEAISELIKADIASGRLGHSSARSRFELMTTDVSDSFTQVARNLMLPHTIPDLTQVDISVHAPE